MDALPTSVTIDLANAQPIAIDGAVTELEYRDVGVDDGQRDLTYSAGGQSSLAVENLPSGTTVEAVVVGSGETLASANTGSDGVGTFTFPAGEYDVTLETGQSDVDPVEVSLADVEVAAGGTTTLSLSTSNAEELAGYEATVSYDPAALEFEGAAGADFDEPVTDVDADAGTVTLTQSSSSAVDGNPNPVLAELTFSVVGQEGDESPLETADLNVNTEVENLPTTPDDGSVTVVSALSDDSDADAADGDGGDGQGGADGQPGFAAVATVIAVLLASRLWANRRHE